MVRCDKKGHTELKKDKKMAKKKNNFSIYWIYAILGVGLIAFQLYMGKSERESVKMQTLLEIADNSGVDNVTIINEKSAEFHLNKEGLELVKKSEDAELKKLNATIKESKETDKTKLLFEIEKIDQTYLSQELKGRDEIGRASLGKECRSRWSPYH